VEYPPGHTPHTFKTILPPIFSRVCARNIPYLCEGLNIIGKYENLRPKYGEGEDVFISPLPFKKIKIFVLLFYFSTLILFFGGVPPWPLPLHILEQFCLPFFRECVRGITPIGA